MKRLIAYDRLHDEPNAVLADAMLDLRNTDSDISELMDVYETYEPSLIQWLRDEIKDRQPDAIIVVGKSEAYRWVGTIICRVFGQFNSWNGQRRNPYGITVLKIEGNPVKLIAVDSFDDLQFAEAQLEGF